MHLIVKELSSQHMSQDCGKDKMMNEFLIQALTNLHTSTHVNTCIICAQSIRGIDWGCGGGCSCPQEALEG
jgi:hypothetical protein